MDSTARNIPSCFQAHVVFVLYPPPPSLPPPPPASSTHTYRPHFLLNPTLTPNRHDRRVTQHGKYFSEIYQTHRAASRGQQQQHTSLIAAVAVQTSSNIRTPTSSLSCCTHVEQSQSTVCNLWRLRFREEKRMEVARSKGSRCNERCDSILASKGDICDDLVFDLGMSSDPRVKSKVIAKELDFFGRNLLFTWGLTAY